jgi:hypothetical protein
MDQVWRVGSSGWLYDWEHPDGFTVYSEVYREYCLSQAAAGP